MHFGIKKNKINLIVGSNIFNDFPSTVAFRLNASL